MERFKQKLFEEKKALVRSSLIYVQRLKETGRQVEIILGRPVLLASG